MQYFRCVNHIREQINPKGLKQIITEYNLKNGDKGTEIITNLDSQGNKGIRTISRDYFGKPTCVTDEVYGRKEVYIPAPYPNTGIIQKSKGNPNTPYSNISIEDLCKY